MAEPLNIESDQFLMLLSDALRNGPGSPEWHQAVRALRSQGSHADEYAALVAARQALEGGKGYRAVRAGPGFTKKLLDGIDREQQGGSGRGHWSPTNVIMVLAACAILIVVAIVGYVLVHSGKSPQGGIEELAGTYFANEVIPRTNKFDVKLPPDWRMFGDLPLAGSKNGLKPRPATQPATTPSAREYATGGIVSVTALPADQPFAINASFKLEKGQDDVLALVFVSDAPPEEDQSGAHELVLRLKADDAAVFLNGRAERNSLKLSGGRADVRIVVGREMTIVESNGQRIYAGPHQLLPVRPRYVGVRFARPTAVKGDRDLALTSIEVQKP